MYIEYLSEIVGEFANWWKLWKNQVLKRIESTILWHCKLMFLKICRYVFKDGDVLTIKCRHCGFKVSDWEVSEISIVSIYIDSCKKNWLSAYYCYIYLPICHLNSHHISQPITFVYFSNWPIVSFVDIKK